MTLPVETLRRAGLAAGDEVAIDVDGENILIRPGRPDPARGIGVFDGLYEPGHLEALRSGERA